MKRKAKVGGVARPFLLGILAQAALLPALSLILALISTLTNNPTSLIGILAIGALLSSGGIYGFASAKLRGDGSVPFSLLSSLFFSLLVILFGLVFSGGEMKISVLIGQVIYVLTSLLFSALGNMKKKRKIRK